MEDIIQGLWIGNCLSTMEQLSINSYLKNKHEFHLYLYDTCEGVPPGTIIKDANEIVPREHIKRFKNIPNFSDYWRWNLLYKKGGYWVDLDTVCVRPINIPYPYVFSDGDAARGKNRVGAGTVKMPAGCPIAEWCINSIDKMNIDEVTDFSGFGPTLLAAGINKFKLHQYIWPPWAFLPIAGWDTYKIISENIPLNPETYVVHLYDNIWKNSGYDKDGNYPETCLYERLKDYVYDTTKNTLSYTEPPNGTLIAIVTCEANRAKAEAQYNTWVPRAKAAGYDVVFFDGENLGVNDSPYLPAITDKASAIYRWAAMHGYNSVLKCDDDCYINMSLFKPPIGCDYAGLPTGPNDGGKGDFGIPDYPKGTHPYVFASGGAAWFSQRALAILIKELPIQGDWADDRWAGQVLARHGVEFTAMKDFFWYPIRMPSGPDFAVMTQMPSADAIYRMHNTGSIFPPKAGWKSYPALIAVITCQAREFKARVAKQMETWIPRAKALGYTVEIFDGPRLDVPDDYGSLILKTKAVCHWALKHGFERMLKVDDDGFIDIDSLVVPAADYAGLRWPASDFGSERAGVPDAPIGTNPASYAMGGGYWLSANAMRILIEMPIGETDWAEDRWVGNMLEKMGITLIDLPGYVRYTELQSPPFTVTFNVFTDGNDSEKLRVLAENKPIIRPKTRRVLWHS